MPREYRMGARAEAAANTHQRIKDAVLELFIERYLDEITLADVAERAGVSVRTVTPAVRHPGPSDPGSGE